MAYHIQNPFVISFSKIYHIIGVIGFPFICLCIWICLCICLCICIFVRIWIADIISFHKIYGFRGTRGLRAVLQLIYELRKNCCGRDGTGQEGTGLDGKIKGSAWGPRGPKKSFFQLWVKFFGLFGGVKSEKKTKVSLVTNYSKLCRLYIFHIKCSPENNTRVGYNKRITWVIDLTQKSDPIYLHYELNTGALLSAAIGQSLLGNWSTAITFHLSHRWEPGIRPQLTINSWLWAEKGVVGLWEVVVKGSVWWEVTVIQVSSSCSLLHSFLPHWRAGHIHALQFGTLILQVGAMYEMQVQCKFLLWWLHLRILPGAHPHHLIWRTLHIC